MAGDRTLGPVEYLVVAFPESRFTGEIARELDALVRTGTIHVLDLAFVTKDEHGDVAVVEVDQLDELGAFAALEGEVGGLISLDDAAHAAVELEPGSSAAVLVWEDLWARGFVDAARRAGAVVVEGGRIRQDEIERALEQLASGGATAA